MLANSCLSEYHAQDAILTRKLGAIERTKRNLEVRVEEVIISMAESFVDLAHNFPHLYDNTLSMHFSAAILTVVKLSVLPLPVSLCCLFT